MIIPAQRRYLTYLMFACIGIVLLAAPPALAVADILILHSYHHGYAWTDSVQRGIQRTLDASGMALRVQIEYMDTARIADPEYLAMLSALYRKKFAGRTFEVIISTDDPAFAFLKQHRDTLFPHTPLVFCGINNFRQEMLAGQRRITGVAEELDIHNTLDLALQLHPKTEHIFIIGDNSLTYHMSKDALLKVAPDYYDRITFHFFEGYSLDELRALVRNLPEHSIVMLLSLHRKANGELIPPEESVPQLEKACAFPIYSCWDFFLGHGIVGGDLVTGESQGDTAATMALQVLRGTPVERIPVKKHCRHTIMLDYRQIQRFAIDRAIIPPDAVIIHQPSPWYRIQRTVLLGVLVTLMLSLAFVAILLVAIYRRRQAEAGLRRTQHLLVSLVENLPVTVFLKDARTLRLHSINAAGERLFGFTKDDAVNKTNIEVLGLSSGIATTSDRQVLQERRMVEIAEMPFRNAAGQDLIVHVKKLPLLDESGQPQFILGIADDITERIHRDEELRHYQHHLEREVEMRTAELAHLNVELTRSNTELEQFAYIASHDLQEPLRKIIAFGDRLYKSCVDRLTGADLDNLERIRNSAMRMRTLIDDLLDYSRVNTRGNPPGPVAMNTVIHDVLEMLSMRIEETGATVEVDPLPRVLADSAQMSQLFQNLISNALKFARPDVAPHIHISSAPVEEGRVEIVVRDNGIGFEERYLDRIFLPFQRLHTRAEYPGSGIGLAICKKIADRHGGTITADAVPGEGATFRVTLLLADSGVPAMQ